MFNYPDHQRALSLIERLHHRKTEYAYSALITALSGGGKTYLATYYQTLYPTHATNEKKTQPVLYCRLKSPRTNIGLLEQILSSLGASSYIRTTKADRLEERIISLFFEHRVELVLIDDVQECLTTVDGINAQRMAKQFASLIDSAKLPFILLGTPSSSRLLNLNYGTPTSSVSGEEQLSRRFITEYKVEAVPQRSKLWLDCVNYFCDSAQLPLFTFNDKRILNGIYVSTHGRLGLLQKFFDFLPTQSHDPVITNEDCMEAHDFAMNSSTFNPFDKNAMSEGDTLDLLDVWRG